MPGFKIKKQEGYDLSTAEKETLEAITVLGDPGADRILFWDDSANTWKFLTIGSGLNITDTTITATSSGDVIGPASATDNAIVRFNLATGKLIQNSNVTIDDNGAMQMPNNQWFSFKDYAGTGSINAFKGTIDDEIDVAAQLNVGTIEAEEDAGAIPLFDMPVSSSSVDGTEMSATIRIDGNNILKVYAEADGAGGADSFAVKLLSGAGLDITEIAATSDTDKFLVSDSNRVKYRTGAEVLSDIGGQASLGFTAENVANKLTSFQATPDDTHYASEKLVKDSLDAKLAIASKASSTEINTGTDNDKYITPDALAGSNAFTKLVQQYCVEYATELAVKDGVGYIVIPAELNGMNLISARATVGTAGTTNASTFDIYNVTDSTTMLSSAISIASGATSGTGTVDTDHDDVATGDIIRIDVDTLSTTKPKGLIVTLAFRLP